MENIENKESSCCSHWSMPCGHHFKKCHVLKKIVMIFIIILAFCLGVQLGEFKSEVRGFHYQNYGRGGMMDWSDRGRSGKDGFFQSGNTTTGEVRVEVTKPTTPVATTPKP